MTKHIKIREDEFLSQIGRCWLTLKQAARKMIRELELDLTLEQVMALKILDMEEGLSLSEVAEAADRERTTMTRMIDGLERKNLVVRISDKSDNRRKLLYLTNLGREWNANLREITNNFSRSAYAGITEEELKSTVAIIQRIYENLDKI